MPETSFAELTKDLKDVEPWIRTVLPVEMEMIGTKVERLMAIKLWFWEEARGGIWRF